MKRLAITILRIVGSGLRNFFRSLWLSIAASAIMVVTLVILLTSYVVNNVLEDTVQEFAQNITVSVFLLDGVDQPSVDRLESELLRSDNVESVSFISVEEAEEIFREQNAENTELLAGIEIAEGGVFPASLEVSLLDLSDINSVLTITDQPEYEEVIEETSVNDTRRRSIDRIASAQDFINRSALVNAGIFAGISVLVIFNTIRIAVFTRSDEIEIMKLVGAKKSYIRGPFLVEAAFYGFVAGIIAYGVVYGTLLFVGPKLTSQLVIDPTLNKIAENGVPIFFVIIILGMLIGLISSWLATNKYLKLKNW